MAFNKATAAASHASLGRGGRVRAGSTVLQYSFRRVSTAEPRWWDLSRDLHAGPRPVQFPEAPFRRLGPVIIANSPMLRLNDTTWRTLCSVLALLITVSPLAAFAQTT